MIDYLMQTSDMPTMQSGPGAYGATVGLSVMLWYSFTP